MRLTASTPFINPKPIGTRKDNPVKKNRLLFPVALLAAVSFSLLCSCSPIEPQEEPEVNAEIAENSEINCTARSTEDIDGGCTISISRPYLYSSENDIAADCDTILIGQVISQNEEYDVDELIPDTKATVVVADTKKGRAAYGDTVIVRQTGPLSLSILENDKTYLFYLNDFKDESEQREYYITGVTAGVFELSTSPTSRAGSDNGQFVRVDETSGDDLPQILSEEEIG